MQHVGNEKVAVPTSTELSIPMYLQIRLPAHAHTSHDDIRNSRMLLHPEGLERHR